MILGVKELLTVFNTLLAASYRVDILARVVLIS